MLERLAGENAVQRKIISQTERGRARSRAIRVGASKKREHELSSGAEAG